MYTKTKDTNKALFINQMLRELRAFVFKFLKMRLS